MGFPEHRLRRFRKTENLRRMVRETRLSTDNLVLPLFVDENLTEGKQPIVAMPGQFRHSMKSLIQEVKEAESLGLPAILLFGIPKIKDAEGSGAYKDDGIVQKAVAEIKGSASDLVVITDVCLCEYTSHGHCGIISEGEVHNDMSLEFIAKTATSHAEAGADAVAPSDMMDGRVGAIRASLNNENHPDVIIISYAAKYASAYYGPFREAAGSAPQFGDRRGYQMDSPNVLEAIREVQMDLDEGADVVMVKPALAYLDVLRAVKDNFPVPLAAYSVSGEYAMIKAAAEKGWLDEKKIVMETLTGIRRAGADMIITYYAKDAAKWLQA